MTEKAHIHFKEDGKPYLIPEFPKEPKKMVSIYDYDIALQKHELELEDAKANALPVVNPELLDEFDIFPIPGDSPYEWPGTWEGMLWPTSIDKSVFSAKLIAPQQTQSDAPNEGREEKDTSTKRMKKDDKWLLYVQQIREKHEKELESLRDQLSKERETIKGFVDSHAQLEIALFKEREMRKELVDALKIAKREIVVGGKEFWEIEPIVFQMERAIAKASELDKNN